MTKLDEVIETVRGAREDGPEALAAAALSFGAAMALGAVRNHALRGQIAELRAAQTAADEMVATMRHERDAALAGVKAAQEGAADTAEVWRLRESVEALRADLARVAAERDRAVAELGHMPRELVDLQTECEALRKSSAQSDERAGLLFEKIERLTSHNAAIDRALSAAVRERKAFSLRLSVAERQRDAALARPTYEARTTAPTQAELEAHASAGGAWLVAWMGPDAASATLEDSCIPSSWRHPPDTWIALGANRLPCAWPVVPDHG